MLDVAWQQERKDRAQQLPEVRQCSVTKQSPTSFLIGTMSVQEVDITYKARCASFPWVVPSPRVDSLQLLSYLFSSSSPRIPALLSGSTCIRIPARMRVWVGRISGGGRTQISPWVLLITVKDGGLGHLRARYGHCDEEVRSLCAVGRLLCCCYPSGGSMDFPYCGRGWILPASRRKCIQVHIYDTPCGRRCSLVVGCST